MLRVSKFEVSRRFWSTATLMIAIGLVGCSQNSESTQDNSSSATPESANLASNLPQVVATNSLLCDLTQQIAEDTIALTCLMQPGQDPHTYAATPSDRRAIDESALVLYGGYNSSPGIDRLIEASSNSAPKVAVYEVAVPDPLMGSHDHGHEDAENSAHGHDHDEAAESHSHDHDEAVAADHDANHDHTNHDHANDEIAAADEELVPDPHVWHHAANNAAIVEVIAANLGQINPDAAEQYSQNADQLSDQFADINTWIEAQVATIPANQRKLVTTHDAFQYFASAYGLEVEGALSGLSTEEQPSAARLSELIDHIKAANVPAIFAETTATSQLIKTVADEAGVVVAEQPLYIEGPGGAGTSAETVQAMLISNTCTVVNALGGTCTNTNAPL